MWAILIVSAQVSTYGAFENKSDCVESAEILRKRSITAVCIQNKE
jgi:hypothetical protein